jgi:alkyl sulfatase BDS1-like metallo-beta-lactamase superfamily hydrolase
MRSARLFIEGADLLLGLEPEMLVTGHDDPIRGAGRIQAELGKVRDATVYIHDRTVEGMNAGKSMWELMAEIKLPPELEQAPESRGPTSWLVRSIWEEYLGWFRQESVTELYETPPSAVWPDVVELSGSDQLAERARKHMADGRPVEALHLTDMVLSVDPDHAVATAVKTDALKELLKRTNGDPWDLVRWLEAELAGDTP